MWEGYAFEVQVDKAGLGGTGFDEGDAVGDGGIAFVGLQKRKVTVVVAGPEKYMLALSDGKIHAQGLADLVIGALLATADIEEVEEDLGESKGATKSWKLVRMDDKTAAV